MTLTFIIEDYSQRKGELLHTGVAVSHVKRRTVHLDLTADQTAALGMLEWEAIKEIFPEEPTKLTP